jgi:hypothetical protein
MAVRAVQIAKIAALVNTAFALAAVYYVMRVFNFTPLSQLANSDTFMFAATAIPPVLAAWLGAYYARSDAAARLLAAGLIVALAIYGITFVVVLQSAEPLAPLALIIVSLWTALALVVLLLGVWFVGRRAA